MKEAEVILLFKCLSDKSRLHIVKSLAMEDMYVERLAERLNLSASTISFHLKKLAEAGIVSSYKTQYRKYRFPDVDSIYQPSGNVNGRFSDCTEKF